jgi:hypothetical protein
MSWAFPKYNDRDPAIVVSKNCRLVDKSNISGILLSIFLCLFIFCNFIFSRSGVVASGLLRKQAHFRLICETMSRTILMRGADNLGMKKSLFAMGKTIAYICETMIWCISAGEKWHLRSDEVCFFLWLIRRTIYQDDKDRKKCHAGEWLGKSVM